MPFLRTSHFIFFNRSCMIATVIMDGSRGKCMSEVIITEDNFETEVLRSDKPVLVDFWAEWCGPCKMIAPAVAQVAEKYSDRIKVAKVNVDEAAPVAARYNVVSIPTLMVFKNGEVVDQRIGAASLNVIEGFIGAYI